MSAVDLEIISDWVHVHYPHGPLNYILHEQQPKDKSLRWYKYYCSCGDSSPLLEEENRTRDDERGKIMKTTVISITQHVPGLLMDVEIARPGEEIVQMKDVGVYVDLNENRLNLSLTLSANTGLQELINALRFDL